MRVEGGSERDGGVGGGGLGDEVCRLKELITARGKAEPVVVVEEGSVCMCVCVREKMVLSGNSVHK